MKTSNYQYFENYKKNIYKEMNILENLTKCKPITGEGVMFKTRAILECKKLLSLNKINKLISEMYKISKNDQGIKSIFEYLNSVIAKDRTRFGLGLACEKSQHGVNSITESMCDSIVETIQMKDEEILKNISNGCLDNIARENKFIKKIVMESKDKLFKSGGAVAMGEFVVKTPISYIEKVDENLFFRVKNNVFMINNDEMLESKVPSHLFKSVSDILNESKYDEKTKSFTTRLLNANYSVRDGMIIQEYKNNKKEYNKIQLIEEINDAINCGYCPSSSVRKLDQIIALSENSDSIVSLSNMRLVEIPRLKESYLFVEHNEKAYVSILSSTRYITETKKFDSIKEGLNYLKKITNFDLSSNFKNELLEESKRYIQETKDKEVISKDIKELEEKITYIKEQLDLCEKGSEAYNVLAPSYDLAVSSLIELKKK